jgi:Cu(I)/Ag(I) efflux system membrane fusion protein
MQAYPGNLYKAKVSFIDPILDQASRTLKLRAVLPNTQNIFKPGMFVEGKIVGSSSNDKNGVNVPSTAILWTGERSLVYIKPNPNEPVFEMREVKLGKSFGDNYEILEGLNAGDEIVTNGTFTIDAAAQLQGKKSMMNKEGSPSVTGHEGHGHEQGKTESNTSSDQTDHIRVTVANDFKQELKLVFEAYIQTKEALVKDDFEQVKENAGLLEKNLGKVDMKLLTEASAHQHWMKVEKEIRITATAIANSEDIKKQRAHFKDLSTAITSAVQMFGVGQVVYNQYCPMADDNKGAYWLSNDKNVLNPYFGSAMLACGSVKQVIEE